MRLAHHTPEQWAKEVSNRMGQLGCSEEFREKAAAQILANFQPKQEDR